MSGYFNDELLVIVEDGQVVVQVDEDGQTRALHLPPDLADALGLGLIHAAAVARLQADQQEVVVHNTEDTGGEKVTYLYPAPTPKGAS